MGCLGGKGASQTRNRNTRHAVMDSTSSEESTNGALPFAFRIVVRKAEREDLHRAPHGQAVAAHRQPVCTGSNSSGSAVVGTVGPRYERIRRIKTVSKLHPFRHLKLPFEREQIPQVAENKEKTIETTKPKEAFSTSYKQGVRGSIPRPPNITTLISIAYGISETPARKHDTNNLTSVGPV